MNAYATDTRPDVASPVSGRVNGAHQDWARYAVPIINEPTAKHLSIRVDPIDTPTSVAPSAVEPTPRQDPDTTVSNRSTPASVAKAVAPLVVVNGLAVYGQLAYALEHIAPTAWPTAARVALSIGFAAAVESVALYVGWHAHDALLLKAHGTARWLRRASFTIAALVGAMNYAHFAAPGMRPTAAACAFGLLSLLSPWMWGLHTRRQQHIQLLKERKVDETGAEFSGARRRAFPVRTWQARRWSIDNNVSDPSAAWAGYKADRQVRRQVVIEGTVVPESTPVAPRSSTPRQARTDTPAGRKPVGRQRRPRKAPTGTKTTPRQVAPTLAPVAPEPTPPVGAFSVAAVANARELRQRFGDSLPTADNPVRQATGWSLDRVKKARDAYNADADRQTPTGATP